MRKVTFPHMGNLNISAGAFFREMGLEVIVPPANSKKTLDLGMKYSPEFACLPLKINIGNFIEAMEQGADTIIMGGGVGPCRFGYYCEVQREILKDLGYDFEMYVIEPEVFSNIRKMREVFNGFSLNKIFRAGRLAWKKIMAVDKINEMVMRSRALEKEEGFIDSLYSDFLNNLDQTNLIKEIQGLTEEYSKQIINNTSDKKDLVRIGIVGEIYLVLEPFINLDIARKLGELGAVVERNIYISEWIREFLNLTEEHDLIEEAARPYLNSPVGGHGVDTIGNTVRYAKRGFDGVVQVAPFTCMPEIVAQTILPEVGEGEDISVLSIFFDEHTGEAGLNTRLEAFIDLLRRKREVKGKYGKKIPGN